ncbi:MAG TPA: dienelactone hydrolase family protein [Steroidobacteraceae bacterium]|nr:dienelactone hydrolase family protein [Steroidobacteraceae bacterium]
MTQPTSVTIQLKAADGHVLDAWRVAPGGKARGGIVVVQEIFGVTRHIENVAREYATAGYLAIAPALFDRVQRRADIPYADSPAGRALMQSLKREQTLLDLKAAIDAVAAAGKVGMVGYCWGGTMTYVAACHLSIAASVAYYGGGLTQLLERTPRCPMMFHFGDRDTHIPLSDVEKVKKAYPLGHYYMYPAAHGFNCSDRASYDAASAQLALGRSLDFFHRHVG